MGSLFSPDGSRFGGVQQTLKTGTRPYTYNNLGDLVTVKSQEKLSAGDSEIRLEIDYDGGGIPGKEHRRWTDSSSTIAAVATGRLETTIASRFSIDWGSADMLYELRCTSDQATT